ncbi:malonyl-CoA decarboxylase domain-containing protein [Sphingomonas flavalba]|uniref:malonyl-CoA decarboxylase domain-containing protein n=1 Tax=Sphingomonas flavalba TaxID=2559804 RepID=UPI0019D16E9C|nr:malonyl-CoA decarboxylase [Sphingomonas flavalba]
MHIGGRNAALDRVRRAAPRRLDVREDLRSWVERFWQSVAQRGRSLVAWPAATMDASARAEALARALLSTRGEASGAAISQELLAVVAGLSPDQVRRFLIFLAEQFQVDGATLADAARGYLDSPDWAAAVRLADAAEPPRQELLRRMNMGAGGTRMLVTLRENIPALMAEAPVLAALDADLRHLFSSWFNRGFLELRQIDWQTPAAILEKLIAYEAVHEIQGWDDLRRRLAPDRRCFAFFHPALPDEPLIFVEVALVAGLAQSVGPLLACDTDEAAQRRNAAGADSAIFYSISSCQNGLRGISFGNFLIKQVVEILRLELPHIRNFSTLSPVPGFRRWLDKQLADGTLPQEMVSPRAGVELRGIAGDAAALRAALAVDGWERDPHVSEQLKPLLLKLCALYLTMPADKDRRRFDPVARFHLGNGARLERINWMGNPGARGMRESWGIMVNYLYDPARIEANHERFSLAGEVARSREIDRLVDPGAPPLPGKRKRAA